MKTVKVDHSILTLAFTQATIASGAGMSKDTVNEMVNKRLADGYDDVQVIPLKSNFSDNLQLESVVNEYIFRKYAEEPTVKSKKE
jgi:hypothetical protein